MRDGAKGRVLFLAILPFRIPPWNPSTLTLPLLTCTEAQDVDVAYFAHPLRFLLGVAPPDANILLQSEYCR